jgi:hypothetical protein
MAGWHLSLVAFAYATSTSVLHLLPTALVDGGDPTTCAALNSLNAPQLSSWCIKSCGSTPSICPPDLCECAPPAKSAVAPVRSMLAAPDAQPPVRLVTDAASLHGADAGLPSRQTTSAAPAIAPSTGDMSAIAANTAALLAAARQHVSQSRTAKTTERQPLGKEVASEVATTEAVPRPPGQNTSIVPVAFKGPSAARWARLNEAGTIELLSNVTNMHPATPAANTAAAVIAASQQSALEKARGWLMARRTTAASATVANATAVIAASQQSALEKARGWLMARRTTAASATAANATTTNATAANATAANATAANAAAANATAANATAANATAANATAANATAANATAANATAANATAANATALIAASEQSVGNARRWLMARRTTAANKTAANTTAVLAAAANWVKQRSEQRLATEVESAMGAAALVAEQVATQRVTAQKVAADKIDD